MSPRSRWVILASSILGLGFASYSAWVHYQLMTSPAYISPCDISSTFNCSQVYLSSYGSVAGVPVALAGMVWFGLVLLIAAFPESGRGATAPGGAYIFALSTIGMAVILYLGYSSWVVLKTACLLCIGTYISVLAIFITSGRSATMPVTRLPGRLFNDLAAAFKEPMAVALAVILLGGTGYAAMKFPPEGTRPQSAGQAPPTADFPAAWAQQPRVDLGIPADGAKVIVVKFNDYQCPGCGLTHAWYKPVLEKFGKEHPGAVKYIVKDWPWDTQCNVTGGMLHQAGCEAAAAVRMGADRSPAKAQEMEDWIYANQTATPDAVKAAAARIVGVTDFDREYGLKLPEIQKDIADGVALRIRSTPTLFINGVRVEELMPASYFELAIQLELNKAAGK